MGFTFFPKSRTKPLSSLRGDGTSRRWEHAGLLSEVGNWSVGWDSFLWAGIWRPGSRGIARVREMQTLVLGRKGKGRKARIKGARLAQGKDLRRGGWAFGVNNRCPPHGQPRGVGG